MDVTACIPGDIVKPGDKLGNTPGAPEGANYENHKNDNFLTILFNGNSGVCGEYRLNFCTWMNCLICPLMCKACEFKAGITKGAL